jgi:hypothetical protein
MCVAERGGEPPDSFVSIGEPVIGPTYGPLAVLLILARLRGIDRALGPTLALFPVLVRVA